MQAVGPAMKITIHVNEDTSLRSDFLHTEILTFLYRRGVSGATLLKPNAGFGSRDHLHTNGGGLPEGEHLPSRIECTVRGVGDSLEHGPPAKKTNSAFPLLPLAIFCCLRRRAGRK